MKYGEGEGYDWGDTGSNNHRGCYLRADRRINGIKIHQDAGYIVGIQFLTNSNNSCAFWGIKGQTSSAVFGHELLYICASGDGQFLTGIIAHFDYPCHETERLPVDALQNESIDENGEGGTGSSSCDNSWINHWSGGLSCTLSTSLNSFWDSFWDSSWGSLGGMF